MTTENWFEYEYIMPGWPGWRRIRFTDRPHLGLAEEPTDPVIAAETLQVVANRFRPTARFRLVHVTLKVFDAPEQEVRAIV